jgi:hypothetical protein
MPICDEKKENHYYILSAQILRHFIKRKKKQVLPIPFNDLEDSNNESFILFFIDLSCGGVDDILKKRTQHCDTTRRWDLNKRRFTSN